MKPEIKAESSLSTTPTAPNARSSAPNPSDPENHGSPPNPTGRVRREPIAISDRLEDFPSDDVTIAVVQAQAANFRIAFAALTVTAVVGLLVLGFLSYAHDDVGAVREVLIAAVAGECGVIAGLMGRR